MGWSYQYDNWERVRVAFALDCCDREVMGWVATTKGIDAGLVGDLMMEAVENRFGTNAAPTKPIEWLTDNGSCYTATETRSFAKLPGLKPITILVTSPQSNVMAESFLKTLKRDYAKLANRPDSKTVMAQLQAWFDGYNSYHPDSAVGFLAPKLFREKQSVNSTYRRYWVTGSRPANEFLSLYTEPLPLEKILLLTPLLLENDYQTD